MNIFHRYIFNEHIYTWNLIDKWKKASWKSFYKLHVQHRWVVLDFVDFFIRHDWKLKIPTVGVKIFSSILAEYSALTQVSNALYQPVSDSRAVKMGMKKECSQILEKIIVVFRDLNLHGCKGMGVHLWITETLKNW